MLTWEEDLADARLRSIPSLGELSEEPRPMGFWHDLAPMATHGQRRHRNAPHLGSLIARSGPPSPERRPKESGGAHYESSLGGCEAPD
jgi:hypothetical protein